MAGFFIRRINASKTQRHNVAIIRKYVRTRALGGTFRVLETQCTSGWSEIEETSIFFWGEL